MNIIQLCGGLGNQLFQYAFGNAQKVNGIDVQYNMSWYKKSNLHRPYRLNKFCVDIKTSPLLQQRTITEKKFDLKLLKTDNCNFKGYWQYLAYCENVLPTLRKDICVKEEFYTSDFLALREQVTEKPSVSIHVRRGDYVGLKNFAIMPLSYYFEALQYVEGDLFIFSNDISWCKKQFKQDYFSREVIFVQLEDYLDFELMKLCDHNIICSSSFSWWAAYLNSNPKKTVIAPTRWVLNKKNQYPKNWLKL